jgi:hypothetical protein
VLKLSLEVTSAEFALLKVIREVDYGEIYDVSLAYTTPLVKVSVTPATRDMIEAVRKYQVDKLIIHQGEPVSAEIELDTGQFRYRKKIKFPTVPTEG